MDQIDILPWDSTFFEMNVGRVHIDEEYNFNSDAFLDEVEEKKMDLVYIVKFGDYLSEEICRQLNIYLTDTMLKMTWNDDRRMKLRDTVKLDKINNESDLNSCYEIAEQICQVSRFYKEPIIGKRKAFDLYRKWIDNSISGEFCDGILLEKSNESVNGIFVVKTDLLHGFGECSLIGVNKKNKRSGVGTTLWQQAIKYWQSKGIYKYAVNFSLQNQTSFNFHLRLGFNVVDEVKHIYHFTKKTNENLI